MGYETLEPDESPWVGPRLHMTRAEMVEIYGQGTQPEGATDGLSGLILCSADFKEAFNEVSEREAWRARNWVWWLNTRLAQGKVPLSWAS